MTSDQVEQAIRTLNAMAQIPSLRGGWVCFDGAELSGGRWYEGKWEAVDGGGRADSIIVPLPEPDDSDEVSRVALRAAIRHSISDMVPMVEVCHEYDDPVRAAEYGSRIAALEAVSV